MPWQPFKNGILMLKKNNMALGVLVGLVLPCLVFGFLWLISLLVKAEGAWAQPFQTRNMMLLAVALNLIPMRIYLVNYKFDKTGRGILLVTFLLMAAFFIYRRYS
jgi:hypothetical protein